MSTVAIVTALAAWLAGAGAAGAAVPGDMSIEAGTAPVPGDRSPEDRVARLFAGLPDARHPRVQQVRPGYAPRLDRAFARYADEAGAPMQAWAADALVQVPGETVFYPFAGADFPSAHRLYPHASRYVLVAMQRGGPPPVLERIARSELRGLLAGYERLLHSFLRRGFFVTAEMNEETGGDAAVPGITGPLMVFAAREGFEIVAVEPVRLAEDGSVEIHPGDRARPSVWESVRLRLRERESGRPVVLEYIRVGLSNFVLKPDTPALAFVAGLADSRIILKAASHLPQDNNFTVLIDLLLAHAPSIVQDETGVAYDALTGPFAVTLHGSFRRVNQLFAEGDQETLIAAYRDSPVVAPLSFNVGYRKGAPACMLVATRPGTVISDAR